MRNLSKGILFTVSCIIIMLFSLSVSAEGKVTLYSQKGDCVTVSASEVEFYTPWGWSSNIDDVRTLLYSTSGPAYVYNSQVSEYLSLGWSLTPVRVDFETPLPTTFWVTNRYGTNALDIQRFDILDLEYLPDTDKIRIKYNFKYVDNTYSTLIFNCYDSYGNKVESKSFSKYSSYIDVSSSTATFTLEPEKYGDIVSGQFIHRRQIDMYSSDGRIITVYDIQAPIYERVGWQRAVQMYALDGRTIMVPPYEVETYKTVGWYTFEGYAYTSLLQTYNTYISSGQYNKAIVLIEMSEKTFSSTEYEYSVQLLKERAMDAWRNLIHCPLAVVASTTGEEYGVPKASIAFRNVSYKYIVAFKVKFTCYNIFGEVERTYYNYYYTDDADLASGKSAMYTWKLYGADSVNTIKNIKVTEVVYSDGTKW